jgi:dipeptide/tripeptide permease
VESLLALGAALVSLRLSAELLRRWRARRSPELAAWTASLASYSLGSAALAWGASAGWDDRAFRVYYLGGGLLTAALLGAGSLLLAGRGWAMPVALLYTGLAVGVAIAAPIDVPVTGDSIPEAQEHLELVPARLLAIAGNSLGTVAAVVVAVLTIRRRPLGNTLLLAGIGVAALGSALAGLGTAESALFSVVAAVLLYGGFVVGR